jgi:predicted CoA-binding protein
VIPLGKKAGNIKGVEILLNQPEEKDIDTICLYIRPEWQPDMYDYILGLNPRRIIFNPGTENPEFRRLASEQGIEVLNNCALTMLTIGVY